MDTFPDLGSLTDQELKDLIKQLTEEENEISYKRRVLHGKIDILRAELVNRMRKRHNGGEQLITGDDVQQLTDEEQEVSYRRRILHGKIDILRAELVNRLRRKHDGGEVLITGDDVQQLTDILAGRLAPADPE